MALCACEPVCRQRSRDVPSRENTVDILGVGNERFRAQHAIYNVADGCLPVNSLAVVYRLAVFSANRANLLTISRILCTSVRDSNTVCL